MTFTLIKVILRTFFSINGRLKPVKSDFLVKLIFFSILKFGMKIEPKMVQRELDGQTAIW